MRRLIGIPGFTLSVFVAVVITAAFALVLDAPGPLVAAMLVLGLVTALIERHLSSGPQQ